MTADGGYYEPVSVNNDNSGELDSRAAGYAATGCIDANNAGIVCNFGIGECKEQACTKVPPALVDDLNNYFTPSELEHNNWIEIQSDRHTGMKQFISDHPDEYQ